MKNSLSSISTSVRIKKQDCLLKRDYNKPFRPAIQICQSEIINFLNKQSKTQL